MKKVAPILFLFLIVVVDLQAQCAMCGAVTEAAQKNGSDVAEGLNAGILYLMGVPYALLLGMGFLLFRKLNQNKAENS